MLLTALTMSGLQQRPATYFEKVCGRFVITLSPRAALPNSCIKSSSKFFYFETRNSKLETRNSNLGYDATRKDEALAFGLLQFDCTQHTNQSRNLYRCIFPVAVFGSSSRNSIHLGYL